MAEGPGGVIEDVHRHLAEVFAGLISLWKACRGASNPYLRFDIAR
jgi:hypothetical protein